jgi:RsiW-degrading membrane proteinase PrsW (M82 family)
MILFALTLCAGAWVLYWNHPYGAVASSLVTVICLGCILFWYLRVYLKWATALEKVSE